MFYCTRELCMQPGNSHMLCPIMETSEGHKPPIWQFVLVRFLAQRGFGSSQPHCLQQVPTQAAPQLPCPTSFRCTCQRRRGWEVSDNDSTGKRISKSCPTLRETIHVLYRILLLVFSEGTVYSKAQKANLLYTSVGCIKSIIKGGKYVSNILKHRGCFFSIIRSNSVSVPVHHWCVLSPLLNCIIIF